MDHTVGTCSICGGRVTTPAAWMGTRPPIPRCESCGATKRQPHGRVIDMTPAPNSPDETAASLETLNPIMAAAIAPHLHR